MFWLILMKRITRFEVFLIVFCFQGALNMLKELMYFSITKYFYIPCVTKLLTEILFLLLRLFLKWSLQVTQDMWLLMK